MLRLIGTTNKKRFVSSNALVVMAALVTFSLTSTVSLANAVQCEADFTIPMRDGSTPPQNLNADNKQETITELLKKGSPVTREERVAIEEKLNKIQQKLKTDFVGWDDVVDQLMNASKLLIFYGDEVVTKPIVVPILGFPGYGKTTLIQRWQEMMGFGDVALQENVERDQTYIPFEKVIGAGRPAKEDPVITQQRPLIDYVLTIDEVQNLMDAKQVDELIKSANTPSDKQDPSGDISRDLTAKRELALKINKSRQFWWEILGNGTYQVRLNDPSVQLSSIESYAESYMDFLNQKRKFESKIQKLEADLATDNSAEIESLRAQMKSNDRNVNQYRNFVLGPIKKLRAENSESLGVYASLSTSELLEVAGMNTAEFVSSIRENYEKASKSTVLNRFNRGIILITGNPNSVIETVKTKSLGSNGRLDAEALRRNTLQVTEQEMLRFFTGKIGTEAGWQSRLNAGNWRILAPFGERQWRALIRQSLVKFDGLTVKDGEMYTGRKIELEFDESLVDQLYRAAVDPASGPRSYFDALNQSLAVLPTQIPSNLRAHMMKHNAWADVASIKLKVTYSRETRELIVREEADGGFSSKLRLALTESPNSEMGARNGFPAIAKAQMAVYQAARMVVGTVMFRSLPKVGVEAVPTAQESIETLWDQPDVNHFEHLKAKLMVSMAGYIAEKMVMEKSGVDISPQAKLDMDYITMMIGQLKDELNRRRELNAYSADSSGAVPLRDLFGDSMSQDKIVAAIYAGKNEDVFRYLDKQTKGIMIAQKDLINALASNLLNKSRLEPAEIKAGFEIYSKKPGFFANAIAATKRILGGLDVAPIPELDVKHIITHEVGSIQNPLPGLAEPYSLRHRTFGTTRLGRFFNRLKENLRNRL